MVWGEKESGNYLKIKEGEEKEFTVLKVTEKEGTAKVKNISGREYYYSMDTDLGTLTINNLGLLFSMENAGVMPGDRVKVKYVKKGVPGTASTFDTTILEKGDGKEREIDGVPF